MRDHHFPGSTLSSLDTYIMYSGYQGNIHVPIYFQVIPDKLIITPIAAKGQRKDS